MSFPWGWNQQRREWNLGKEKDSSYRLMTLFKPLDPAGPEAYTFYETFYETFCCSELMTCSQFSLLKQAHSEFISLAARVVSNMVDLKAWSSKRGPRSGNINSPGNLLSTYMFLFYLPPLLSWNTQEASRQNHPKYMTNVICFWS